ncbi:alpha/beta hydrolase [Modestobacter sp. VKM Ac-2676]|nr:alpha/beta hydrolase [Modestobacter sp. VKM Ac-2676]
MLVAAGLVVTVLALVTGLLWVFQRALIYLPQGAPTTVPRGAEEVVLETGDGLELSAWWFSGPEPDAPAVLVANGNGGHRGLREPLARRLQDAGLSVLLFDYRGYAGNPGSPSEAGLALDVRAARSFLVEDAGVPPERLVYFGESLGAAVVTELSTEHPPAGLVLRSPFQDLAAVASVHYPVVPARLLLRDRFPVAEQITRVDVPTIVVYGSADSIVPPEQSRTVAEAAAGLQRVVEVGGANHNDPVLLDGEEVTRAVLDVAP